MVSDTPQPYRLTIDPGHTGARVQRPMIPACRQIGDRLSRRRTDDGETQITRRLGEALVIGDEAHEEVAAEPCCGEVDGVEGTQGGRPNIARISNHVVIENDFSKTLEKSSGFHFR